MLNFEYIIYDMSTVGLTTRQCGRSPRAEKTELIKKKEK
jgi:hypothetical protein